MIYSLNNYNSLKKKYKKQKSITACVGLTLSAVIIMLIVIIFKFKLPYLSVLGGIVSLFLFVFLNLRLHFVHKELKCEIEFYSDVLYGERQNDVVEFKGKATPIVSNGKNFLEIEIYSYKEESENKLLIDRDFPFTYVSGVKYLIEKSGNILIDYKEYENEKIC